LAERIDPELLAPQLEPVLMTAHTALTDPYYSEVRLIAVDVSGTLVCLPCAG
jgi:hypothetical protein